MTEPLTSVMSPDRHQSRVRTGAARALLLVVLVLVFVRLHPGLLGAWGADPCGPPDFNGDGNVDAFDLANLLGHWGSCP